MTGGARSGGGWILQSRCGHPESQQGFLRRECDYCWEWVQSELGLTRARLVKLAEVASGETPSERKEPPVSREQDAAAAAEALWVALANVSGGDWTKQTPEWQEAAARAREHYFWACGPSGKPDPDFDTEAPASERSGDS